MTTLVTGADGNLERRIAASIPDDLPGEVTVEVALGSEAAGRL